MDIDLFTFYHLEPISHDPLCLGFGLHTKYYPKTKLHPFQKMAIFDLCSGIGGFTMGSSPLGIETLAFLECNDLACQVLRANFMAPVIQGKVEDLKCVQALHELKNDSFLQVTGGFPCQPFSRQGDMKGEQDVRGTVLASILRCSSLLQADALLLECVDNVIHFSEIMKTLEVFAEHSQMHIEKIVFDLQTQWPARRRRFWCLLFAKTLPELHLQVWPACSHCQCIGHVMPHDAIWPEEHERDLQWDQQEMAMYFDLEFGQDIRILMPQHKAPTMLHSWANVLRPCPCGCRMWPLSLQRLRAGGARGFGINSALLGPVRHLHPEEGALLCTVPLDFQFPPQVRTALCLLGQIAAPLQVLWIQSQLLAHLQEHYWVCPSIQPLEMLHNFKHAHLTQRAQRWKLASMSLPRTIQITLEDTTCSITLRAATTVAELERAESMMIGHGHYVVVKQYDQRLPPWCQLHAHETYELQIMQKRQARPSSSIWPTAPTAGDGNQQAHCKTGLGDTHIWAGMNLLLDFGKSTSRHTRPLAIYPFRAEHLLRQKPHPAVCQDWQLRYQASDGRIMIIYEFDNHWTLLVGRNEGSIQWTHFDGLLQDDDSAHRAIAERVAACITHCLDFDMGDCTFLTSRRQQESYTCGTVALMHMADCLQLTSKLPACDEPALHDMFCTGTSSPATFTAEGKGSSTTNLEQLLISKGVPALHAAERVQMINDKLGSTQVQQIMTGNNPWNALKAAATRPGRMFRIVTEEEQKAYVDARAQSKHGAKISNSKQKKQASMARGSPVQLDPDLFRLNPQHFQDEDGESVPQIAFQDVEAEQQGIALCTTSMAKQFLENPKSISLHGLALLIIDAPPMKIVQEAGLVPMIFPALCTSTDEHTIIMGHILQLGDSTITRKMAGNESAPDKIDTQVIKLQVYRDQFEMDWTTFSQAPVRHIIHLVDAMQLCKGNNCGVDCAKYHPGIDESLDAVVLEVWSRTFMEDQGKKTTPSEATQFTVFIRLPESALQKIMVTMPLGIYLEPRGHQPREQDDKFRVIWLPGTSHAEAQHQCRTYSKSLCLVRFKNKYGIRVKKADEAAAWAKLRPGIEFIDMSIQRIYELFPIPHGTQRQAISKILSDWQWKARALQPGKGNFHHMAWRVGSSDAPPAPVMTAFGADVVISAVKELQRPEQKPQIYATAKTQKLLRETPSSSSNNSRTNTSTDPWLDKDPWGGYQPSGQPPLKTGQTRRAELQEQIRHDVQHAVARLAHKDDMTDDSGPSYTTENEMRFVALESGLNELQQQNGQFMQWFQQTGDRLQQNENVMREVQDNVTTHGGALQQLAATVTNAEKAIGEVHNTLNSHQQEIHSMGTNFQTAVRSMKEELSGEMMQSFNQQYGKLEALLEKRHKTS